MVRRKSLVTILLTIIAALFCSTAASATVPYQSYNYDYWGNIVPSPVSYEPVKAVSGSQAGTGKWNLPSDMSVAKNGDIYIADTGNNRIVVLNSCFALKKTIKNFSNKGKTDTFNLPSGITVDANGKIHVADTGNHRIVSLNPDGTLLRTFGVGKNNLTGSNFNFQPSKVGVDASNRYYVVAKNVFQGMMSFDKSGNFFGYFGTIKVQSNAVDKFWKMIATKEQKAQMQLFIPTEFSNLDIDSEGFVYATDLDFDSRQTIRKLNPSGKDVLVNYNTKKPVCGDLSHRPSSSPYGGPTKFVDIKTRAKGLYSALDSIRGRVYTYDSEGNLLYIFGGVGNQVGTFKMPVAIETWEDSIYVLDQAKGQITVFHPTKYGQLINTAVGLRYDGQESKAVLYWKDVLKLDSHYELAYSGIGKSLLSVNKNREAMEYLKKGMNKRYYSVAFRRYRNEWLKAHSKQGIAVFLVILAAFVGKKLYRRVKERKRIRDKAEGVF